MTVEPDAARSAHRTGASTVETHLPNLAPGPTARVPRNGFARLDKPPPWTGLQRSPLKRAHAATLVSLLCVGAIAVAGHALYDQYFGDTERAAYVAALARKHAALTLRPNGASHAPAEPAGQPNYALLNGTGLLLSQAGTGLPSTHAGTVLLPAQVGTLPPPIQVGTTPPSAQARTGLPPTQVGATPPRVQSSAGLLSMGTGTGEAALADRAAADAPAPGLRKTAGGSPPTPHHATAKAHDATARVAASNNWSAQRAQSNRRAGALRHPRMTRDTRRDQQASDPLDALRRMLHASWWHAPPRRNRLDSGPHYKGQ